MKRIKRKDYKKIIKEFRKECTISQVTHKWITFLDTNQERVLMFVHGNIVKRTSSKYFVDRCTSWQKGELCFGLELYGKPILKSTWKGLEIQSESIMINKYNDYKVLETPEEVEEVYDKIFEDSRKRFKYKFKK